MPSTYFSYAPQLESDRRHPVPYSPSCIKVFKFGKERRTNSDSSALCWPYLTQYRALVFLGEAHSS